MRQERDRKRRRRVGARVGAMCVLYSMVMGGFLSRFGFVNGCIALLREEVRGVASAFQFLYSFFLVFREMV